MIGISRQSEHFPAAAARVAEKRGCHACGEPGPTERHAAIGSQLCAACTEVADGIASTLSGPAIPNTF